MRKIASLLVMLMLFTALAFGQNRTITGTVSNEKGDNVPGATIVIKGTRTGVSADNNGQFRILAKTGDILLVSSSGMESSEVTVGAASTINLTIKTVVLAGTEVVVTALGIKRQPKELGYAIAKVGGTELTQARTVNLQNGLTGKVSGLNIQTVNNGVFADTRITLRGIRSLTGNNQPLLVLDGVPMALGFINSINPNDIQDVSILKGNAGAAVYGQDGTNGAIIVTTKKGSKGRTRITVGSSFQAEKVSFLPDLQNEFGSGETENVDGTASYDYFTNNSFGPRFDGSLVPLGDFLEDGSRLYVPYSATNPARKFWNTGTTFQNDISFSGGDESSTFLFSVQDARIRGIVPKDENRRTSFRFNATKNFDKLTVGFNVSYIQGNYNVVNQNRGGFDNIYTTIMKTSPFIPIEQFKDWKNNKFATSDGWYNHFGYNPYMLIDIDRNKGRSDDILGNIDLSYKLSPSLTLGYRLGTTVSVGSSKSFLGAINNSPYTAVTRGTDWGLSTKGSVSDALSLGSRITSEAFITYRKEFNKLTLDLLGGQSLIQRYSKSISVSGNDLVIPELYNISNRTGEPGASEGISRIRTLAVFGQATIGWNKFAFLKLTGRNESDSRLNINKNAFFYPGADLSFLFSEAIPAIKNSSIFSYMKLRVSYAKSGNVNLSPYSLESTFSGSAGGFPYGTLPGYTTGGTVNNPLIKPEFVSTYEVGLEVGMLKNRVFLEASVYTADNSDQIIGVQVSRSTGYTNALVNAATFQNKGIEFDLKLTPLVSFGKNASVNLKMNYSHQTNKVTKIYEGLNELGIGNNNFAIVGKPAFVLKLIDWARDTATGSVIVGSTSGLPSLNTVRTTMGGTLPRDLFGGTLTVKIKNFTFNVVADYRGGNFIFNSIGGFDLGFNGVSALSAQYERKPFVFPNSVIKNAAGKYVQNTSVLTPGGINWWTTSTFYNNEAAFYTKADFWKIREASLVYEVPQKVFSKANSIKGITITLTGRNLLTVLPKSNVYTDPEFSNTTGNSQGVNNSFNTPPTRIFGAAVNVNF